MVLCRGSGTKWYEVIEGGNMLPKFCRLQFVRVSHWNYKPVDQRMPGIVHILASYVIPVDL